jgi:hypothetical protein
MPLASVSVSSTKPAPISEIEPDRKRIHMPDVAPLVELKKR